MAAEKNAPDARAKLITDQQVKLPTSGDELRKNVNVLNTSSAENPAPNPFVQNQANTKEKPQSSPITPKRNGVGDRPHAENAP
jgi:hypothetical protein